MLIVRTFVGILILALVQLVAILFREMIFDCVAVLFIVSGLLCLAYRVGALVVKEH